MATNSRIGAPAGPLAAGLRSTPTSAQEPPKKASSTHRKDGGKAVENPPFFVEKRVKKRGKSPPAPPAKGGGAFSTYPQPFSTLSTKLHLRDLWFFNGPKTFFAPKVSFQQPVKNLPLHASPAPVGKGPARWRRNVEKGLKTVDCVWKVEPPNMAVASFQHNQQPTHINMQTSFSKKNKPISKKKTTYKEKVGC